MAVTERLMGAGNFSVTFSQDNTPTEVIDAIQEWGHIVITPQEMDPNLYSDAEMLASARYTGIVLQKALEEGIVSINGAGLQLYLGDDKGKGMVIAENKNVGKIRTYSNDALSTVLFSGTSPFGIMRNEAGNLQAITQGTIFDGSATYSGSHFVETALHALKHICEDLGYEFRVNPDATLDAGPASNLFVGVNSDPTTVVVKTGYGDDPTYTGISPVGARTEFDAVDYVTKVDFIAEVGAFNEPTDFEGEASKSSSDIPYYDIHGNKLSRTGLVTVPDMDGEKLDEQAQLMLTELSRIKKVLNLDLEQYEVTGDLKVGDFIFAFDPFIGFNDTATDASAESRDMYSIVFRGQEINPIKVRVVGLSFPIQTGMGVYFRKFDGSSVTYTDLTEYVSFESGNTQVELGDVLRDVTDDLRFNEFSIAARTAAAKSIPDLPSTPTLQSGTYLDGTGESKGFVRIVFSKPSNIDGSTIVDGSHYRVRYRINDGLSTSGGASANEYTFKDFPFTGASTESLVISDLTVGKAYRVGVATVDTSGFRRKSDFTATGFDLYTDDSSINSNFATNAIIEIDRDGQAPSQPKQATAISAGPLRVQITHYLGKAGTDGSGNPFGDFTLEGDVDHLDIHAVTQSGNSANFTVNTANKIGELRVTSGNILQQIPVIGSLELEDSQSYYFRIVAVDKSGNASTASDGQSAVANLIQEANIGDATISSVKIGTAAITEAKIANLAVTDAKIASLTADKLTAGTIDASVITVTNLSASNITSGNISADRVSGGTLDFNNVTAGNLDFSSLSVQAGDIVAQIAAGEITDSLIGGVSVSKLTAGSIVGDNITLGSGSDTSGSISSHNFVSGSTGFQIQYDGDAFFNSITVNNPVITLNSASSNNESSVSSSVLGVGDAFIYENSDRLHLKGDQVVINDLDGSSETSPALTFQVGFDDPGFYAVQDNSLTQAKLYWSSGTNNIIHSESDYDTLYIDAANIAIGTDTGQPSEFIGKNSSGQLGWHSVSTGSHDHDSDYDDYGSWTLKRGGSTVGNVSSGFGASWNAGSGLSVSSNNNPFTITYSVDFGGNNSQVARGNHDHGSTYITGISTSGSGPFISSASGSTITRTSAGANTGSIYPASSYSGPFGGVYYGSDLGTSSKRYANLNVGNVNEYSDENSKNTIEDAVLGLDFINELRPVSYKYNETNDYTGTDEDGAPTGSKAGVRKHYGFIAQEVKQVLDDMSVSDEDFAGHIADYGAGESLRYREIFITAIKAIQELSEKVDSLTARIEVLEG